jgi:hypothetical protein
MEWSEEGAVYDWKNVERVATFVLVRRPGESGVYHSTGGIGSKLGATDQLETGCVRVGSIRCPAFGGLERCDQRSM